VAEPTIVDKDEALAAASSTARRFLSQRGPEQYLRLRT
jgi:hypothetical protein